MTDELQKKRSELKKRLLPLEWDMKLKQINFAREMELKACRLELENIEKQIAEMP